MAIDVSQPLTRAVAHALWEQVGGNDALNWLEAERLVQELLGRLANCTLTCGAEVQRVGEANQPSPLRRPTIKAAMTIEAKDASRSLPAADAESAGTALRQAA